MYIKVSSVLMKYFLFYRLRNGLKFSRVLELPEVRILNNIPIFSTNHHVKFHCDIEFVFASIYSHLYSITDPVHSSEEIST